MPRTFKHRDMQRVYDSMVARENVERIGPLGWSYHMARKGVKGIHFGIPGSLMRAAWWAGHDAVKRGGK